MIKKTNKLTHGGTVYEGKCDHCTSLIFSCSEFQWEGEELIYSPLLCEQCGRKHSKDIGEDVKKIELLEKEIKRISKEYPFALSELRKNESESKTSG